MFVCLDVCVYFLRVFTAKMPYTQTPKTHTHLYLGGSKLSLIYDFFILNVNSRLICEFKRSTVKQTRKPVWRSAPHKKCRNAPYTHTHIHTHTFVFFFQGLKPCFMQACIWGNLHFLHVKNALLGHGWGTQKCFTQAWILENRLLYM